MADLILAHDLGTSGNKATLHSVDGSLVASHTATYETHYFNANWAEQNPERWWSAVIDATRAVLDGTDPARVGAVSFSGQMMGCVCVDERGRAVRDAIIWADQRSVDQVSALLERLSLEEGYRITGHRISPSYTLSKLLWVRDHEPEAFSQTYRVLNPKDFIVHRLTGAWVTDVSDASGTNALDLKRREWSDELLTLADLDPGLFPDVLESTAVAGAVTPQAAASTGLVAGTPVVCGAGDGLCAAVGAGCIREGTVYTYLGSSAWIATATQEPLVDPELRTFTFAHAVPGLAHPCGTAQAIGGAYDWLRRTICLDEQRRAEESGVADQEIINEQISQSPVGANGLLFLPYLVGERSPWWNPSARGAFVGLKMEHQRADLLRSVVEGAFLTLRLILDIFRPHIQSDVMDVIGGFARGAVQQRIMADVYGMPVAIAANLAEATSMGAAVIGGVGSGMLEGFDAVDRFRSVAHVVEPDPVAHARYSELLGPFTESYRALEPLYERLSAL